jgi:hypothetical protein
MLEVEHTANFELDTPFQKEPPQLRLDFHRLSFVDAEPCIVLQSQLLEFANERPKK